MMRRREKNPSWRQKHNGQREKGGRKTDGEREKDKTRNTNIRATDGLECMILHLVLMMMIRKHNTHRAVSFHKANNPGQTRMFNKEQESTHRQLN